MDEEVFKVPSTNMQQQNAAATMLNRSGTVSVSASDGTNMERNRREKMSELYDTLQSMVPDLFPRATRVRIIDSTISYIKTLEEVFVALNALKKPVAVASPAADVPMLESQSGPAGVSVSVSPPGGGGGTAFFGIASESPRAGLAAKVAEVFERHDAEVLAASFARDECRGGGAMSMTVTAALPEGDAAARIRDDLLTIQ